MDIITPTSSAGPSAGVPSPAAESTSAAPSATLSLAESAPADPTSADSTSADSVSTGSGSASARPQQLSLLPRPELPARFRLDDATRARGLRHVAELRRMLAERQSARDESLRPRHQPRPKAA